MCYTISRNALYRGEPNMKIILRDTFLLDAAETSGINGVEGTLANLRSIRDELAEEVFDITGFVDFLTIEN